MDIILFVLHNIIHSTCILPAAHVYTANFSGKCFKSAEIVNIVSKYSLELFSVYIYIYLFYCVLILSVSNPHPLCFSVTSMVLRTTNDHACAVRPESSCLSSVLSYYGMSTECSLFCVCSLIYLLHKKTFLENFGTLYYNRTNTNKNAMFKSPCDL